MNYVKYFFQTFYNMLEDINFANRMYTKISDLKIDKLKYNKNLDYLYYEEPKKVQKKNKKKKNKEKEKNKEIRLYIFLFVLFCFLNSYFIINIINSYKIQYTLSLIIRALIFLVLYYLIKTFF